ncbi:MAG: hypothetical protein ACK47B_16445 [Armatimonadota bacterium]
MSVETTSTTTIESLTRRLALYEELQGQVRQAESLAQRIRHHLGAARRDYPGLPLMEPIRELEMLKQLLRSADLMLADLMALDSATPGVDAHAAEPLTGPAAAQRASEEQRSRTLRMLRHLAEESRSGG